jgi:hypothetical protein
MIARMVAGVVVAGVLAACAGAQRAGVPREGSGATLAVRSIDEVLAAHNDSLMALPGVVGTAIGLSDGERCIKVLVADSNVAAKTRIPARLEGYRIVVEVTGTIRPR